MSEFDRQSKAAPGKSETHTIMVNPKLSETLNFYAGVNKESGTLVGNIEIHIRTVGSGGFSPLLNASDNPVVVDASTLVTGVPVDFPGNKYIDEVMFKFSGFSGGTVRTFVVMW